MTVEIHAPSNNEMEQARWNLESTKHLEEWHDWLNEDLGHLMYVGFVEHNPLSYARPIPESFKTPVAHTVEFSAMVEHDSQAVKDVAQRMLDRGIIPFKLLPPDTGVYYMVQRTEIDGKKYSFYTPCHPTDKPGEGEEMIRLEKPLKPIWPDILRVPPEPTISEVHVSAYGIRKSIPEGSFEQPTVTLTGWGPNNFQFKF